MFIVHLSNTIVAGAPVALSRGIKEFSKHDSVAISNSHFRWKPDIDVAQKTLVIDALSRADVLHCHGNFLPEGPGQLGHLIRYINPKAKRVYQAHSLRRECPLSDGPDPKKYKCLVVAQGWSRYWPSDWIRVRNVIFIDDKELKPIPWEKRKKRIVFTPSNRFCNNPKYGATLRAEKPNPKGWRYTIDQLRGLPLETIESMEYKDCLNEKRNAWLGIDEIVTPQFHRSGLEFLSQGVPCIESMDDVSERDLLQSSGADENPFIVMNEPKKLRYACEYYLGQEEGLRALGDASRQWMEQYWNPQDVVLKYIEVYESL